MFTKSWGKLKSFGVIILYLVLRFCQGVLYLEHNLDAIMNNSVLVCILYSWKMTIDSQKDLKPQANRHLWCFTAASVGNSRVLHFLALAKHLDIMGFQKHDISLWNLFNCVIHDHEFRSDNRKKQFEKNQENLFAVLPSIVHGVVKLFNWRLNIKY